MVVIFFGTTSSSGTSSAVANQATGLHPGQLTFDTKLKAGTLALIRNAPGLRFFWWNIHFGSLNVDSSKNEFRDNLYNLIKSDLAPDIMGFAEYNLEALGGKDAHLLRQTYPYVKEFWYPESTDTGVAVYSKYPFDVASSDRLSCGGESACNRVLPIIKLWVSGSPVTYVPVHLFDSWRDYLKAKGPIRTIKEIFNGTDNPVWQQILQLRGVLEGRAGSLFNEKNFVVMGDFNTLKPSKGYVKIAWNLKNPIRRVVPTFPARGCDDRKQVPAPIQIDHVFVSKMTVVTAAEVLPIKGSDHYALYLVIDHDK